jgi:hypothetical protein
VCLCVCVCVCVRVCVLCAHARAWLAVAEPEVCGAVVVGISEFANADENGPVAKPSFPYRLVCIHRSRAPRTITIITQPTRAAALLLLHNRAVAAHSSVVVGVVGRGRAGVPSDQSSRALHRHTSQCTDASVVSRRVVLCVRPHSERLQV